MYKLASIEEIFVVMEDHNMTIQNMLGNYYFIIINDRDLIR